MHHSTCNPLGIHKALDSRDNWDRKLQKVEGANPTLASGTRPLEACGCGIGGVVVSFSMLSAPLPSSKTVLLFCFFVQNKVVGQQHDPWHGKTLSSPQPAASGGDLAFRGRCQNDMGLNSNCNVVLSINSKPRQTFVNRPVHQVLKVVVFRNTST